MPTKRPTKYAEEPAPLLCPVCKKIFEEPIISVKCGHTFCRQCIENLVNAGNRCPLDGLACDSGQLVLNLAIMGQLADLKIYCCHGLCLIKDLSPIPAHNNGLADGIERYDNDPDGCPQTICIGKRKEHEDNCQFALVECPIAGSACGPMRKRDLDGHMKLCSNVPCSFADFGEVLFYVLLRRRSYNVVGKKSVLFLVLISVTGR